MSGCRLWSCNIVTLFLICATGCFLGCWFVSHVKGTIIKFPLWKFLTSDYLLSSDLLLSVKGIVLGDMVLRNVQLDKNKIREVGATDQHKDLTSVREFNRATQKQVDGSLNYTSSWGYLPIQRTGSITLNYFILEINNPIIDLKDKLLIKPKGAKSAKDKLYLYLQEVKRLSRSCKNYQLRHKILRRFNHRKIYLSQKINATMPWIMISLSSKDICRHHYGVYEGRSKRRSSQEDSCIDNALLLQRLMRL